MALGEWKVWLSAILFAGSIGTLYVLYIRRQEEEPFLLLKLLGYSVLGAFTFSFNDVRLPLGFAVFLLIFAARRKLNPRAKHRAAYLGLVLFLINWLAPTVENWMFERERTIEAASMNVYEFDFGDHWRAVLSEFEDISKPRLERFEAGYREDGKLLQLRYEWVDRRPEGFVYYTVELSSEDSEFTVKRNRIGPSWVQYDRSQPVDFFFARLDETDLRQIRPEPGLPYYGLKAEGTPIHYGMKDMKKYAVRPQGIEEIDNSRLPVAGHLLTACGARARIDPYRVPCDERADFLFDARFASP